MKEYKRIDVLFDLETLSTNKNAAIIQISAKTFGCDINETFDCRVDLTSQLFNGGFDVSPSTIEWWKQQDYAQTYMDNPKQKNILVISVALKRFKSWIYYLISITLYLV